MMHEEDGRLLAYLDGELPPADVGALEAHLATCPECTVAVSRLGTEKARIRSALAALDVDATAASARVRERLRQRGLGGAAVVTTPPPGAATAPTTPSSVQTPRRELQLRRPAGGGAFGWLRRNRVLQAALFVLFMAGGVSALVPGSPLRRWLAGDPTQPEATSAPALLRLEEAQTPELPEPVSLSATPSGGRLRISLQLPAGTDLRVVLSEGDRATVSADPSTRFESADGLLEATVSTGAVRVELPRGVPDVRLEVGGQLYMSVRNGEVELNASAADSSAAEFSFRVR